uniref:Uncharacterized protein n=1 Tax=Tanacetum cinerariifolium TaxID=118510 RepID=A0A6L2JJ81_TANCI|nr:hypothetical protein [Tanacetum cinerariifolium]
MGWSCDRGVGSGVVGSHGLQEWGKDLAGILGRGCTVYLKWDTGVVKLLVEVPYDNRINQHYHTIKDDGIVCGLKFVRIGKDYQEYRLPIHEAILKEAIKQSEFYRMFIKYSTGRIHPNKSRVKRKTASRRVVKKKVTISATDNIILDPYVALELGKSISITEAKEEEVVKLQALKESKRQQGTRGLSEGTGTKPGVPDESTVVSATSNKLDDEEKDDKEGDADDEDDETEFDKDDIYKYKIHVHKDDDDDEEMNNDEVDDSNKGDKEIIDATKADAEKTSEVKDDPKKAELPPASSILSELKKHTTDLIQKYSLQQFFESSKKKTPTVDLEQGSEKSASKILKIKKEQAEKQQKLKFSIKSTNRQLSKKLVEEPIVEVGMDDASDDVVHDNDNPQDASEPKTAKTLNLECIELEYNFYECFNALIDIFDWNNLKVDRYPFDLSKPLPPQGPLGHQTVVVDYFFNNYLEYLKTFDPEILGVKSVRVKKLHGVGYLEEIMLKRDDHQLYKFKKFSNGTLKKHRDELHHRVLDFDLGYNKEMERRKWTATDKKRSTLMVDIIDKRMRKKKDYSES